MARFIARLSGRCDVPPISTTCALAHEILVVARLVYYHRAAGTKISFISPSGYKAIHESELLDELQKLITEYGFQDLSQDGDTFYATKLALPALRPTLIQAIRQQIRKIKNAARRTPPRFK